jgi:predicted DNA-binding antitoxin AbrB/MazE fold protein
VPTSVELNIVIQHLEAVFEDGVLRPLGPLSLPEKQHVMLTITEVPIPASPKASRLPEQEWLRRHSEEFAGQWVALDGDALLSHGSDAFAVRDEAKSKGVERPLMVHIPEEPNLPSAGWM